MDVSPHTSGVCKYSCAKDGGGSLGLENFKEKLNVVGEVPLVFDVGDLFK